MKKYKDKVLIEQELPLWRGLISADLEREEAPVISWKGHPIPWNLWLQMLGFFRHINAEHHSEAQVRLAYNPDAPADTAWRIIVLPQRVATGMFSGELKDNLTPEQEAQREAALASLTTPDGVWHFNGTNHSHCDASAFQSGTDYKDEMTQPGVHLTFGQVSTDEVHVHGRVVFRGVLYPIDWKEWVPVWEGESRRDDFTMAIQPDADLSFPKEWLDCCYVIKEPVRPVVTATEYWSQASDNWSRSYAGYWSKETKEEFSPKENVWDDEDLIEVQYECDSLSNGQVNLVNSFVGEKDPTPYETLGLISRMQELNAALSDVLDYLSDTRHHDPNTVDAVLASLKEFVQPKDEEELVEALVTSDEYLWND